MIKPADSDEEKEMEDSDKAIAVKDDPEHTIAVTRGEITLIYTLILLWCSIIGRFEIISYWIMIYINYQILIVSGIHHHVKCSFR